MENPSPELSLDSLRVLKLLGRGATGTVLLVDDDHHRRFALKVVEEKPSSNAGQRARREISVLRRLSEDQHPFLPRLIGSDEKPDLICWATPHCSGGDLNSLCYKQNDHVFSPAAVRFYAAEIILAVERLHADGIAYRDLKPENILVQPSGHVTLTDFDLSRDMQKTAAGRKYGDGGDFENSKAKTKKQFKYFPIMALKKIKSSARVLPVVNRKNYNGRDYSLNSSSSCSSSYTAAAAGQQRSNSFVGTEEYVAPEVVRGDGHEFAVDWWALGVLCYEMTYGKTPFKGRNRKETFQKIVFGEAENMGRPNALTDLIGKLLAKDPTRRLGFRGAWEVKEHEFFRGLRWDLLTEVLRPPFVPLNEDVTEVDGIGVGVREYLERIKQKPSSTLGSPSRDEEEEFSCSVSLTEF